MPFQMQININTGVSPDTVTFDPSRLEVKVGDQIFWSNNDSKPHWPGLRKTDESIDETFFMPNQIAPDSSSSTFSPGPPATDPVYRITEYALDYVCSLHCVQGESCTEQGKIVVRTL